MKKILVLILSAVGVFAAANDEQLSRLATRVERLVTERGDRLTRSEQLEVRQHLTAVLEIFRDDRPGNPPGRNFNATTEIGPLSRRAGGAMMYVMLVRPVEITSLVVAPRGSQVRVHSAVAVSENNAQYRLYDLEDAGTLRDRQNVYVNVDQLRGLRIKEIRLQPEAWANGTTLEISASSPDRNLSFDDGRGNPLPPPPPPTNPPPRPRPGNDGFYCSAACADINRKPDFRNSRGASSRFQLEAEQLAKEEVLKSFRCSYGVVTIACSEQGTYERYNAIASCQDINNKPDLRNAGLGAGSSLEEAKQKARESVQKEQRCSYGITIFKAEDDRSGPQYCVAACQDINGRPDARNSKGVSGNSEVEAMGLAIKSVATNFRCSYGIVVDRCSR